MITSLRHSAKPMLHFNTKKYILFFIVCLFAQQISAQKSKPVITGVTEITSSQAIAHWNPVPAAVSYIVRKYPLGSVDYTYYIPAVTDTFRKVVSMLPSTYYSVQVKAIFSGEGDSSDWSAPFNFVTRNGCDVPFDLKAKNITDSSVKLRWTLPLEPVSNFIIRYRELGSSDVWLEENKNGTIALINIYHLSANTNYEWQIRSNCDGDKSVWVKGPVFTTSPALKKAGITTAPIISAEF